MRTTLFALAAGAMLVAAPALAQSPAPITETANVAVAESEALASNLVGLDIANSANEKIGEIEDIVLDSQMGVKGLVLSVGGFLGVGTRYVVVPPTAVKVMFDTSAKEWKATTALNKDQLGKLAEFKYEGKFAD